jgi:hypothetical protein
MRRMAPPYKALRYLAQLCDPCVLTVNGFAVHFSPQGREERKEFVSNNIRCIPLPIAIGSALSFLLSAQEMTSSNVRG